jgi:hypothetical protein
LIAFFSDAAAISWAITPTLPLMITFIDFHWLYWYATLALRLSAAFRLCWAERHWYYFRRHYACSPSIFSSTAFIITPLRFHWYWCCRHFSCYFFIFIDAFALMPLRHYAD